MCALSESLHTLVTALLPGKTFLPREGRLIAANDGRDLCFYQHFAPERRGPLAVSSRLSFSWLSTGPDPSRRVEPSPFRPARDSPRGVASTEGRHGRHGRQLRRAHALISIPISPGVPTPTRKRAQHEPPESDRRRLDGHAELQPAQLARGALLFGRCRSERTWQLTPDVMRTELSNEVL